MQIRQLLLRSFEDSDLDALYAIQGDRDHMRHTFWAESREACEEWMRSYENRRALDGFAPWTIVRREDARVIGWGGSNIDPHSSGWGIEVSYFIGRSCEGRGFASELVRAFLRHGFVDFALEKVGAFARLQNLASIRVLENAVSSSCVRSRRSSGTITKCDARIGGPSPEERKHILFRQQGA